MASPVNEIKGSFVNFILPQEIWLSNNPGVINKIEINADDGNGFRQIIFNQPIGISYTSLKKEGIHNIIFKLTLNSGETLLSRINIKFGDPQKQGLQNPPLGKQAEIINADRFHFIESDETFNGKKASAILSIKYAAGRGEIRKPLIVAEGYDPGIITKPENVFGEGNLNYFIEEIEDSDSGDLYSLLIGSQEYDIIYVDWVNGVDDMRRNAKLLKTIINWVNNEKANNGSSVKNVVLGQSMGGVISRYALREMELENTDHDTRLYVSHDAPHQGANVPYGLQYLARHARNEYVKAPLLMGTAEVIIPTILTGAAWFSQIQLRDLVLGFDDAPPSPYPSPYTVLTLADMPASRQLLKNFIKRDYTRDNSVHDNWQNELEALGYPQENGIKNVAISNGSECGTPQDIYPGDYLFRFYGKSSPGFFNGLIRMVTDPLAGILLSNTDLMLTGILPGSSKYNYDIWARTVPNASSNQQVYKGRIVYTKKLLFLFPIDVIVMNRDLNAPLGSLPIDTYPGGFYNIKAQIDLDLLPGFIGDRITHLENFNFIPVTSALDIGEGALNLDENDYLRTYSGGTPPSSPNQTPFDNFITAFNTNSNINPNEQHISFEIRNANWLARELNGESNNIADCSFTCKTIEIEGADTLCNSGTYSFTDGAGPLTWSVLDPGNLVTFSSVGNEITLTQNTGNETGSIILKITYGNNDCGIKTVSKSIWIGKPDAYTFDSNWNKNYMGASYSYEISHYTKGSFSVFSDTPNTTFTWNVFPSINWWQINNNTVEFDLNISGNYTFTATADNGACTHPYFIMVNIGSTGGGFETYAVYPNPASEEVFIEDVSKRENNTSPHGAAISQQARLGKLYDFSGNLVITVPLQAQAAITRLEVANLKAGLYFLKIQVRENEEVYKIIVAH